jgi:hypothetical protein
MTTSIPELIFIHGLAKKPEPAKLMEIWLWGLDSDNPKPEVFGFDNPGLNLETKARANQAYWADVFYTDHETELGSYYERIEHPERVEGAEVSREYHDDLPVPDNHDASEFVEGLVKRLGGEEMETGTPTQDAARQSPFERVPLPTFLKKRIIKQFAVEAYYFLYGQPFTRSDGKLSPMRDTLRNRLIEQIKAAKARSSRVVIVSHSMGTMIAYDCLRNVADCPEVDGLITLGSPLGLDEVQDPLIPGRNANQAFPERLNGPWINIYDPLDPICGLDPRLANDFLRGGRQAIVDIKESNWGDWRHTITHYLSGPQLRNAIRELAGI